MQQIYHLSKRVQFALLLMIFTWLGLVPYPGEVLSASNDLVLHFLGYAVAGCSIRLALPTQKLWQAFLLLFSYSFAIEVGQYFVPTRSFDWRDLLANGLGIATGLVAFIALFSHLDRWIERLLHPVGNAE
ncbi:VanZ family protein [Simiduia sp. 21SJ11W-1]|uniref:VanZ family protein n=1 Tax=Simiduia sp. 21SJ11W-1 TaxID=2909669 RepID=UPI00209F08F5|nr:VanZ family protein [Simiduia sp. 21SJ11W-1]UTA48587.1 VanZ family protein [Simiduia sp. 21SJ11W-1]